MCNQVSLIISRQVYKKPLSFEVRYGSKTFVCSLFLHTNAYLKKKNKLLIYFYAAVSLKIYKPRDKELLKPSKTLPKKIIIKDHFI